MFYLFNVQCLYFSLKITQTMYIKSIFTPAVLFFSNKPYTLAGLEPGIICSAGGRDDHYTTP
jgi:hypothetical protein